MYEEKGKRMLTAEANIEAENPSRFLVQLCRHARNMDHKMINLRSRHGRADAARARPEVLHVEWSDTEGILRLNVGRCTLRAGPGTLAVRVEASDEENLRRIQDIVAADLERFGRRGHLTVTWQGPQAPRVQAGEAG